jgi:hypothetical protein
MVLGAVALFPLLSLVHCNEPSSGAAGAASASASAAASAAPAASPSAAASAAPSAVASAAPLPDRSDCPKGSTGPGTYDKPCMAKGASRVMVATWNGKTDDKGPYFNVKNTSPLTILYGKIDVYFYDKAGKQLDVKTEDGKTKPYQACSGANLFGGVVKANENYKIQVSCVPKSAVPDGAVAMEGEVQLVGFADATEKKNDFYWRNDDLVPDQRKKGGVK